MFASEIYRLDSEGFPVVLRETMRRVGADMPPAEFMRHVVDAFREVERIPEEEVRARFHSGRPYRDFRNLLAHIALPAGARVLAIGCHTGFVARPSGYAETVVREMFPELPNIEQLDVTPEMLLEAPPAAIGPYDLVVTHSLLHFVYDLKPLCRWIGAMVAPGGRYVMANEPNARFWDNPHCAAELQRISAAESRRHQLRKFTDPSRYWAKLMRTVRPEPSAEDVIRRVNILLKRRLGLNGDLTTKEVVRIVDPYLPDTNPGDFRMASDGLNWSDLERGPLSSLAVDTVRTSGYVMRSNPDRVPARWRDADERLATQYPLDGCSFTAVWRKPLQ